MNIKVIGYVDEVVDVDEELYNAAEAAGTLTSVMNPILATLSIDLTYGREEEFNGS